MYARKLKSYSYVNKNMILKVKHFSIDLISVEVLRKCSPHTYNTIVYTTIGENVQAQFYKTMHFEIAFACLCVFL